MKYVYGAFSDIGNCRPNNEDRFFVGKCSTAAPIYLCIVCDGIGGMKNGEVASEAIIEHIKKWSEGLAEECSFEDVTMSFLEYIYTINNIICGNCKVNLIETGSTMAAVLVSENKYMAANVGDSRIYHMSRSAVQISEDDVVPASDGQKNVLSQCVGFTERLFINTNYGEMKKNECLLICSDGFYKLMEPERMARKCRHIQGFTNIDKFLKAEIEHIKRKGERDNITACVIKKLV